MSSSLHEVLEQMTREFPGCLHTSVIDADTGLALAAASQSDPLDSAGADAFHSDLYRLSQSALAELPAQTEPRQIVLTSKKAMFLSVAVEPTGYLWLVVARRGTTVGFLQALMRKHTPTIEESVQALVG